MLGPFSQCLTAACAALLIGPLGQDPGPRADRSGDPLPDGALARLGTVRFRHGNIMRAVAFSPDGKVLASGGMGGAGLCLWEASSGRALHRLAVPRFVQSLAFSPDGKTVFENATLRLIDAASGKEVRRLPGGPAYYRSVAYSPTGRVVAAGELSPGASRIVLWDPATGRELRRLEGHGDVVNALAFSPDGKTLASASNDQTVRLWDVASGVELFRLPGHEGFVYSVAYSADGRTVASAGRDRLVRLWDGKTGAERHRLRGHEDAVLRVAFTRDGKRLASAGRDGVVCLWDAATGKELRHWRASAAAVSAIAFAPGGKALATAGSWDSAIRLWDPATGRDLRPAAGHTGLVDRVWFTPDGKTLLSHGRDCQVLTWDVETATERRRLTGGQVAGGRRTAAAVSPDGKVLAAARSVPGAEQLDPVVRLWDAATGKRLHSLEGHKGMVRALAFSRDGRYLASGGDDGQVFLWEAAAGRGLGRLKGDPPTVWSLAFSPDGSRLAVAARDKTLRLYAVPSGREVRRWDSYAVSLYALVFSPDGRRLASSDRRLVRVWDVAAGKAVRQFGGNGFNRVLAFSPDGRLLAGDEAEYNNLPSGDVEDRYSVHLWELASAQEVLRHDTRQGGSWSLAFSPDGRALATGGGDSTILLWDLTGHPARPAAAALPRLWDDLGGPGPRAYRALRALAAAPRQAAPFLKGRLRPVPAAAPRQLARLIADLDSPQFALRRQAARELEQLGELAVPALRQALDGQPSAEARRLIGGLLEKLAEPLTSPEQLRALRAVAALEQMGTPEARDVLAALGKGAPEARLTRAARAALGRLAAASRER